MAKPSQKSEAMEAAITSMFGVDRRSCIARNVCVPAPNGCGKPAGEFRDAASKKEYTMSGMCQTCQDNFFGE